MAVLILLEPRAIAATWPRIEKQVSDACQRSGGRYEASDIRQMAERGEWQLWIAVDEGGICAVGGSSLIRYPRATAIHIHFGTGHSRKTWQHFMDDIVAWGKSQGATIAESNFRKGWRRVLPGWLHTHDSVERIL